MRKKFLLLAIATTMLATACSSGREVSRVGANASPTTSTSHVNAFRFDRKGTGWVLTDKRLDRTSDKGRSWSDRTPSDSRRKGFERGIVAASFVDGDTAWIARKDSSTKVSVSITRDAGTKWSAHVVKLDFGNEQPGDGLHLFTLDAKHGWLVAKAQSSNARSAGVMYRTTDGGSSWSKASAPIADSVGFTNATSGWLTGGPAGNQLFDTADGGATWQQVTSLPFLSGDDLTLTTIAEPLFANDRFGIVPVQVRISDSDPGSKLYFDVTNDGGKTWTTAGDPVETSLDGDIFAPGTTRVSVVDADTWFLFADRLYATSDGGKSWSAVDADRSDLVHTMQSQFVSADEGWAYLENTECAQVKSDCTSQSELIRTTDGGRTWTVESPSA